MQQPKNRTTQFFRRVILVAGFVCSFATAEHLPIKSFTTADGLSSNVILGVATDSRGFIWFCTRDGLSRFDGYQFVNYSIEQGLPEPAVTTIIESSPGNYWVATNDGRLCTFRPTSSRANGEQSKSGKLSIEVKILFQPVSVRTDSRDYPVNDIFQDRSGQMWGATIGAVQKINNEGILRYNLPKFFPDDRQVNVACLVDDSQGSLWIGTNKGLFRRFPDGEMIHYSFSPTLQNEKVQTLLVDREGRIWIGHEKAGLFALNPGTVRTFQPGKMNDREFSENLMVKQGVKGSVVQLPEKSGEVRRFTVEDGIAENEIVVLHQTPDGRIWIGTSSGLSLFDGKGFRTYTTANGLLSNKISGFAEDGDGNLWIATPNGGMKLALDGM
ncbi:MAG: hypothetical protein HYZ34_09020, partial [Ignavibacteriae bacterium]|nr:hypothetical protein [Ignavibacteriota bacterium]